MKLRFKVLRYTLNFYEDNIDVVKLMKFTPRQAQLILLYIFTMWYVGEFSIKYPRIIKRDLSWWKQTKLKYKLKQTIAHEARMRSDIISMLVKLSDHKLDKASADDFLKNLIIKFQDDKRFTKQWIRISCLADSKLIIPTWLVFAESASELAAAIQHTVDFDIMLL